MPPSRPHSPTAERWIIHLPTVLTSRDDAIALAASLRESLGHVSVIDFREVTFSEEHGQHIRHRLFCNLPVDRDRDRRCTRQGGHDDACADARD